MVVSDVVGVVVVGDVVGDVEVVGVVDVVAVVVGVVATQSVNSPPLNASYIAFKEAAAALQFVSS